MTFWLISDCRPAPKKASALASFVDTPLGTGRRRASKSVSLVAERARKTSWPRIGESPLRTFWRYESRPDGPPEPPNMPGSLNRVSGGTPMRQRSGMGRKSEVGVPLEMGDAPVYPLGRRVIASAGGE